MSAARRLPAEAPARASHAGGSAQAGSRTAQNRQRARKNNCLEPYFNFGGRKFFNHRIQGRRQSLLTFKPWYAIFYCSQNWWHTGWWLFNKGCHLTSSYHFRLFLAFRNSENHLLGMWCHCESYQNVEGFTYNPRCNMHYSCPNAELCPKCQELIRHWWAQVLHEYGL